ncbi:transporter substrate-binding domain-containing protein [Siculibacillus lacustris]|uniref:Transporter substrate-binding domain-containing protein n=1 Tax=Siculibacillus lacustris TaxID=1549641 RepID=A0A4V2KTW4_9HYPH|nr:ABC transporter substrate-binding protein [Siculibacillus lacustris]TBW38970.1 transporter substrate-binding domain-containing protein [Siculibacillus lacustris]
MCERCGTFYKHFSRRSFLRGGAMAAGASLALPPAIAALLDPSIAAAAAPMTVKATHGTGFCNLGFFLAKERGLAKADGVDIDFVVTPSNADIATLFGAGIVDMSMIPYSNFMTLYDAGAPVRIVAGGGVEGCVIVAREGIKTAADLKGKTFGTFQADTLEVLPYDWLKKHGLSFKDVDVRYMNTSPELAQAFMTGAIDAICHIEPYATQTVQATKGASVLSDGTDVYGKGYSDCVLAVRTPLLEKNPEVVRAVIKAMFTAQKQSETDREGAIKDLVGSYFKTSLEAALDASRKQPVMVDQRNQTDFIIARGQTMKELGYVKTLPDRKAFDWAPLERVIAENKDLYASLKLKSA